MPELMKYPDRVPNPVRDYSLFFSDSFTQSEAITKILEKIQLSNHFPFITGLFQHLNDHLGIKIRCFNR